MNRLMTIAGIFAAMGLVGCASKSKTALQDSQQIDAANVSVKDAPATPLSANTHFATGQLAESSSNFEAAIDQYKQALKIDSNHLPSLFRLAYVYSELRQFDDAIATWKTYLKATDYSPTAYGDLGFCYELASKPLDAEKAYQSGLKKDTGNLLCRTNYGLMLARRNNVPEAIKIWQPVLTPAEIHYNLASVYELSNRKREARIEYRKAIELDPKLVDAKSRLAQLDTN